MEFKHVQRARRHFSALLCAQIVWRVLEDSRQFFSVELSPADFRTGANPRYPVSMLTDINPNVNSQREMIMSPRFPVVWRAAAGVEDARRGFGWTVPVSAQTPAPSFPPRLAASPAMPSQRTSFPGLPTASPYSFKHTGGPPLYGPMPIAPPSGAFSLAPPSVAPPGGPGGGVKKEKRTNKDHVHPLFLELMAPVIKKHGYSVSIRRALEGVGKTFADLPGLKELTGKDGKSAICWSYLLGLCSGSDKCHFKTGHIPKEKLPEEFVKLALAVLAPAMAKYLDEPPKKKRKGGKS